MANQLETNILEKIKAYTEESRKEITSDTELTALNTLSLGLTEIIFDLEEEYGIEIKMNTVDVWSSLKSIGEMAEAVRVLRVRPDYRIHLI